MGHVVGRGDLEQSYSQGNGRGFAPGSTEKTSSVAEIAGSNFEGSNLSRGSCALRFIVYRGLQPVHSRPFSSSEQSPTRQNNNIAVALPCSCFPLIPLHFFCLLHNLAVASPTVLLREMQLPRRWNRACFEKRSPPGSAAPFFSPLPSKEKRSFVCD